VVHVAESVDALSEQAVQLRMGLVPARPFLVCGQYSMVDATRQPAGKETAWAYTHVPQRVKGDAGGTLTGTWDASELEAFAERIEAEVERLAPGFGALVRQRRILGPHEFEASDPSLRRGALNAGTAQVHQQLVFRPTAGLGRPETPVRGLYLASASAHPGGGVHGGPGWIAAGAALHHGRARRVALAAGAGAAAWLVLRR
jgi:phytoene dehydrogenase-like protein